MRHGQAAIVLCEAFAMTGDEALRKPAEGAVRFIVKAQYNDGGWRYQPGPKNRAATRASSAGSLWPFSRPVPLDWTYPMRLGKWPTFTWTAFSSATGPSIRIRLAAVRPRR